MEDAMKYRRFGRTEWKVSEIGYGMWGMVDWSGSDEEQVLDSLQLAVDLGVNFFDTAWAYGKGRSEKLLGQLVRANPDKKLYTATKIPPKNGKWPARPEYTVDDCYPPGHIEEYTHLALEHSGLESFDLMQLHTWHDGWMDDTRWIDGLQAMKQQGLFSAYGISLNRFEPFNGIKGVQSGLVDSVQVVFNLFDQNPEDELFPACEAMDVAVIARVPFDEGALTGSLTLDSTWPEGDWRNKYFQPGNLEQCVARAEAIEADLPQGMSLPEAAPRVILNDARVSTMIPGMRRERHVRANAAASDAGPLPEELLEKMRSHRWLRNLYTWS
jgi:aryl-alcohol dehydrogenase-like predicted oxidoreductase